MEGGIEVGGWRARSRLRQDAKLFGIRLIDPPEAAKLTLDAVEITMVISRAGNEAVAADEIAGLDPRDNMHRERKTCDPGCSDLFVFKVKLRRRCVFDASFRAEVVAHCREQVRLDAAHEVQIAQGPARIAGQRRRPQQARGTPSEKINDRDRREIVGARHPAQQAGPGQAVAVLVEVDADTVAAEIDDVGGAGAVGIGQVDAALVEGLRVVEPRHVVHGDLGTEAAVADVGPVADLALANAHEIAQTITGHIGQIDGLRSISEYQARPSFLVERERNTERRAEPFLRIGFVPAKEHLIIGDEDVGVAVAGQIDEAQVGALPVEVWQTDEGAKSVPGGIVGAGEEPWSRRLKVDQIEVAIAREVQQLLPPATQCRQRGAGRHAFARAELAFAKVGFVVPGIGLFGQHPGDALAVKVDPSITAAVDAGRKVLQIGLIDFLQGELVERQVVERADRIAELKRRQ